MNEVDAKRMFLEHSRLSVFEFPGIKGAENNRGRVKKLVVEYLEEMASSGERSAAVLDILVREIAKSCPSGWGGQSDREKFTRSEAFSYWCLLLSWGEPWDDQRQAGCLQYWRRLEELVKPEAWVPCGIGDQIFLDDELREIIINI